MSKQEFPYTSIVPNRVQEVDASSGDVDPNSVNGDFRCVGFYVGVTGDVEVVDKAGNSAVFTALPVGTLVPVEVDRFESDGTTSTDIVALGVGSV